LHVLSKQFAKHLICGEGRTIFLKQYFPRGFSTMAAIARSEAGGLQRMMMKECGY
jgi:hypothetical protein